MAEHWIVAPGVAGSSPVGRPLCFPYAPIAQPDRALAFEAKGRGFESLWARSRFAELLATPQTPGEAAKEPGFLDGAGRGATPGSP